MENNNFNEYDYQSQQPASYTDNAVSAAGDAEAKGLMITGIVAAALAGTGIGGIIAGIIGINKSKAYVASFGPVSGKAKVGSILSKVGLWAGVGIAVYYIFCIIIGVAAGLS